MLMARHNRSYRTLIYPIDDSCASLRSCAYHVHVLGGQTLTSVYRLRVPTGSLVQYSAHFYSSPEHNCRCDVWLEHRAIVSPNLPYTFPRIRFTFIALQSSRSLQHPQRDGSVSSSLLKQYRIEERTQAWGGVPYSLN